VVERHVAAFGKALDDNINSIKAELKPRYVRAGVRVVGEHPSAAGARKLAAYYDDLVQEIALDVRVDGDATVGHTRPFGAFVALRYTEAVGRESGGFSKYLQNQQNAGYFFNPYGSGAVNYREDFEKQVREKFDQSFEIVSITFHEEKVQARGYGRPGWRETPYAYLVLKAKDGSVDRIPSLQLDLDFADKHGQVVLPVVSQVQLIDARPETVPSRPVKKIELVQVVDERELGKGALSLETKATARGLLPELKDLLDLSVPGFKVGKIDDKGLAISKMDAEADEVAPVAERNWLVALEAVPGQHASTFHFPISKIPDALVTYKRYADADLVEVKPELALAGLALGPRNLWGWVLTGTALLFVCGAGFWWWGKQRASRLVEAPSAYVMPGHITPFTVLNLLLRMRDDQKLAFDSSQRAELNEAITGLQKHFFSRPSTERNGQPDLEEVARQWVSRAA
jgi:hypothetical protein